MSDSKKAKYLEYKSKLNYHHSNFDFNLKISENDFFKIILIYEKEIEYYLEYNFIDIKSKNPLFNNIDDFFRFLNECKDKYRFRISSIDKEFCNLTLQFADKNYKSQIFHLSNKDKSKNIGMCKEKKILSYKVEQIIEMCNKSKSGIIINDISFEPRINCYNFFLGENIYIIFYSKIKVEITINNTVIVEDYIRTNYDIIELIKKNKIDEEDVFLNEDQLGEIINYIDCYVKNKKLKLKIKNIIPQATFRQNLLNIYKRNYTRSEYSQYFSEYFENYNPENKDNIFKFKTNELREEIYHNIIELRHSNTIQKYKITGPFSIGKSITLFVFSKTLKNVIYINLKVLKKNKDDHQKCLKIIFSEISRVAIDDYYFNEKIKSLEVEQNILKQLLFIIKIILDSTKENIILILDQYKSENYEYEKTFPDEIKKLYQWKNFNIVLCSSINDKSIRDKVIETWTKYNGNPPELNSTTQEYYFYYYKLFIVKRSKSLSYRLFHKKYKYIKKLGNNNIEYIYNKIIEKLKKFETYNKNKFIYSNTFNLADVFIFLKYNINIEIDRYNLLDIIPMIPLKYFCIDIKENTFLIEPIFPFINYCLSKYINIKDCDDFFKKKKYLNLSYLSNKVKGEYFEFSAIKGLLNPEIIKLPFNYYSIKEVTVKEIVKMNELVTTFDDLIEEFNRHPIDLEEEIYDDSEEENDIEENEEEKKDEEEKKEEEESIEEIDEFDNNENNIEFILIDENNNIIIDLDKEIENEIIDQKIEEIIFKYFLNDFTNDFQKDIKTDSKTEEYIDLINEIEKENMKGINDYKREVYEEIIIKRKKEILKKIEEKKKEKEKLNKKGKLKIPIIKKNKMKKGTDTVIKKYNGNETFLIKQGNKNGELFDYAILYGNKNQKTFIGFQMKCFGLSTSLTNF